MRGVVEIQVRPKCVPLWKTKKKIQITHTHIFFLPSPLAAAVAVAGQL